LKKIVEFNSKFESTEPFFLSEIEIKSVKTILDTIKNTQFYHTSTFSDSDVNTFNKKLGFFPDEFIIPYLDCFRMFLLHPRSIDMFRKMGGGYGEYARLTDILKKTTNDSVKTLILRIFANLFLNEASRNILSSKRSELFDILANLIDSESKTVRGALVAVFFK
jgi:hypothetical protein